MDPTGPTAQRFPLIARPRPSCTALTARVATLGALADQAAHDRDPVVASRVHNQAALIASDCGQPDLARAWCHRHARAYLDQPPADIRAARQALEPLVNLARLHIRAGHGDTALALLDELYQAVLTRTETTVDSIAVPAANLTRTAEEHRELSHWLWSVHLADGTRALTSAGRWEAADAHLRRHHGIGRRMLDGRQVAVIGCAIRSEHTEARRLLAETDDGEPWEAAVTACLTTLVRPTDEPRPDHHINAMLARYQAVAADASLAVFRTRLALSIIDSMAGVATPSRHQLDDTVDELLSAVIDTTDGYAARELLSHPACTAVATAAQTRRLAAVLYHSHLGQPLPPTLLGTLEQALATSETVIERFA